ncbi:MAG TPA: thioredoxin-disulfide reductase [Candidatus Saccharimonadales bacterium]|nr:thioredoxin-disulfide reductase [Candidatus Saccharimonadales bacterium]
MPEKKPMNTNASDATDDAAATSVRTRPVEPGEDGSNPFGGLAIDFTNDVGAVPFGNGQGPITPLTERQAVPGGPATSAGNGDGHESRVVIVGSGPAGLTAAIYAARANLSPIVLAGSAAGGQLMITSDVENYPGFPDGIQGPELMAMFRAQAERFGARIIDADIDRVDFSDRPFRLWARDEEYRADSVIVATGASALWLGLESETRLRGRGVSACATCDGFFFRDKEIAVVGGGDTALEEALFLTRFASRVHLVHRRETLRGSKIMQDRVLAHPKISLRTNLAVDEVLGHDRVEGVRLRHTGTGESEELPVEGLFIAIGYRPNTEIFRNWLEVDPMGYLVVRDWTGSKIDGVFIAGDVHDHRYRQAVTAAGDGCRAAIDAERWLESQGLAEEATATAW